VLISLEFRRKKNLDLKTLITKRITLEEAVDAFKYYDREKWIKIIVEPQKIITK